MDLKCAYCKLRYSSDESPSDDFCSQFCSELWVNEQSWEVEKYDDYLDADTEDSEAAARDFTGYVIFRRRSHE